MVAAEPPVTPPKLDAMAAYVEKHGGSLPIRKILIANNGMAATKAILSMRQWCYLELGDEKAIEFVVMATPDDLAANAEFIRLSDGIAEVPGGSNRNNYANVDLIVELAKRENVDAVWPGWGHASENPALPRRLSDDGIKFIGPTSPVMAVLGDKIAANILAQTAKVPSIPWSGDGLTADLTDEGTIPTETFNKAMVTTLEEATAAAKRIGFPVMVKASEGGGGKGIRMSNSEEELRSHFVQVQNEVVGSPIFMMQLCTGARHIEVQIVGDEHGNAVALNGRDCSTQRRFQKIFEEGPPTIVPADTFKEMERAAQRLTQNIGYRGAGTVEYLYNPAENKFYFLELNPRLQVEHPVTEGLTNANLPSLQLQVAMGIPLYRIPDIRQFYGLDRTGTSTIDFMTQPYAPINNHVIAARITAENPDEGFKPTSGRIERVKFQSTSSVWGYFSVGANGGIHEFADSQFGHLFASGPTREAARKNLVLALKEIEVRGEIRTTVEYLVQLLETPAFKDNTIDTSWLDGLIREKAVGWKLEAHEVVTSAVIYRAFTASREKAAEYVQQLEKGQTGLIGLKAINAFPIEISYEGVKYTFSVNRSSPDTFRLTIQGKNIDVHVREQPDGSLLATFGGSTHLIYGMEEPLGLRMQLDGKTILLPNIFDPSELRSDITGKIVRYLHENNAQVNVGEPFVEVEAMKMIMPLKCTESGMITHELSPGSIINAGDLLASLQLKDPSKVKKVVPFSGVLDIENPEPSAEDGAALINKLSMVLSGYELDFEPLVQKSFKALGSAEAVVAEVAGLLRQYLAVETLFAGQPSTDAVIADCIKGNKDALGNVITTALSHQQLPLKNKLVLSLLRGLQSLGDRFGDWRASDELLAALGDLAGLQGKEYGEVALVADSLLTESRVPPFDKRVGELRALLKSDADYDRLSLSPSLSAGVDLLSALFDDDDDAVRKAALEVYIRRVYRAHKVLSLNVNTSGRYMTVDWTFRFSDTPPADSPVRIGHMTIFKDFADVSADTINEQIGELKKLTQGQAEYGEPLNVLHAAFLQSADVSPELVAQREAMRKLVAQSEAMLKANLNGLRSGGVRGVSFLFRQSPRQPRYLSFRECSGFVDDPLRRDMRPSFPYIFELERLSVNYDLERLATVGRNSQIYLGVERDAKVGKKPKVKPQTLFLRAISYRQETYSPEGANKALLMALDELERAMLDPRVSPTASSRVFLHMMPDLKMETGEVVTNWRAIMDQLISRHATRLLKLRVDEIEVKIRITEGEEVKPIRLMASSMSGEWLRTDGFLEYPDPVTGVTKQFCSLTDANSVCLLSPYPTSNMVQIKRAAARRIGSTYAYDFLGLIEVSLIGIWEQFLNELKLSSKAPVLTKMPANIFDSAELVMKDGKLTKEFRIVGTNKVGMLAWHTTMRTPEYPAGREVVIIANDVTFQSGSFGVEEDEFFRQASEYARTRGLPRVYISSNSGARIGLVDDLKPKFKIAWNDENSPGLGFKYLYLSDTDYKALAEGTVNAEKVEHMGETRWALKDIIGQVHGIGVENLRGSGMIAGETSRAYDQAFTLSYVTGRSVGIGAYLVRLGQRTIQMKNGPIILTGYSALNKLLGREVYTSQDQLGGPQVMFPNGVSHLVVEDDQEGVAQILRWLSYVPKTADSPPPQLPITDPITRKVEYMPPKTPYDPRDMCTGRVAPDGSWVAGFFDRGSYQEYLAGWGKSVVVGRARLGGIPMGIINVETRLSEQRIPADPANSESREVLQQQAGQVWFPDSAYKTAQAINDFNHGENLPLIIFANWRGFSGGTRDMFGEILKFGAQIVDALVAYKHPVFVYIPPNGELRGGAWVVVDPTINEEVMEMYADTDSRGGILEPPGICEVKFRAPDQVLKMHQLDVILRSLDADLEVAATPEDAAALKKQIKEREDALLPMYLQVAHEFADLHDRAGRMKAKGVVRDVVDWKSSREYFYWRTKRRLAENEVRKQMRAADPTLTYYAMSAKLAELCPVDFDDDAAALDWLSSGKDEIDAAVAALRVDAVKRDVSTMLEHLPAAERAAIVAALK
ncbi:acetyl-CoA carboxylase [Tribonema minus]|uniref:Acetyl-CoA carboxylase n=1 Tax=Tribonema minus TaxID=303371 RepID=A0A836CCC4_9STRA|nr:acetyl-CoA carboxylase [Tribonema minus]